MGCTAFLRRFASRLCLMPALLTLAFAAPVAMARADPSWSLRATSGPSARFYHAMAYDTARGRVVLFGGSDGGAVLGDTWEWDGTSWAQHATSGPSARFYHAMAYDTSRGRVVLFGGYDGYAFFGDTWEWDGTAWSLRATTGPQARGAHSMAYDAARARVVLFGGLDADYNLCDDTWEWDGTAWSQRATTGPSGRGLHAMAYDAARARVVLFGGADFGAVLGDTWEWDGTAWSQRATTEPTPRSELAMAYDAARGRVVRFGGWDGGIAHGDTWEWDGAFWAQRAKTGPSARCRHAMAYDAARGRVVLFGGVDGGAALGDTWELPSRDCPPSYFVKLVHGQVSQGFVIGPNGLIPQAWTSNTRDALYAKWSDVVQARSSAGLPYVPVLSDVFDWADETGKGVRLTGMSRLLALNYELAPSPDPLILASALLFEVAGRNATARASRRAALRLAVSLNGSIEQEYALTGNAIFVDMVAHSRGTAVTAEALRKLGSLRRASSTQVPLAVSATYLEAIDPDAIADPDLTRPYARAGFLLGDPTIVPVSTVKRSHFHAGHAALNSTCMSTDLWFGPLACWLINRGINLTDNFLANNGYPLGHGRPGIFPIETLLGEETHNSLPDRYAVDLNAMVVGTPSASPFAFQSTSYFGELIANPLMDIVTPGLPGGPPLFPGGQTEVASPSVPRSVQPVNLVADPDFSEAVAIIDAADAVLADPEFQAALTPELDSSRQFLESMQADQFVEVAWARSGAVSLDHSTTGGRARLQDPDASLRQSLDAVAAEGARFLVSVIFGFDDAEGVLAVSLASSIVCGEASDSAALSGFGTTSNLRFVAARCDGGCQPILSIPEITITGTGAYVLNVSVAMLPALDGDADGNNAVNFADITNVLENWGFSYPGSTGPGDADHDGAVDFADITKVLENWGVACP